MNILVVILVITVHTVSAAVTYENQQVWRIFSSPDKTDQVKTFVEDLNLNIWSARSDSLDVVVTPENFAAVELQLLELELSYYVMIDDIQEIIDSQEFERNSRNKVQPKAEIDVNVYHPLDDINDYVDELAEEFDYISVEVIGQSVEGRDMRVVRLATQENNPTAMWVQCGAHAREWVSPASCVYGLNYFTNNYGVDATITAFLDSLDIYMVVNANPDGYNYSWTDDRMWRKNRRVNEDSDCFGVDLNRNYDDGLSWAEDGASSLPCAPTFYGSSGFSEPELIAIRDKVTSIQETQTIKSFYDVHSYSNLWLYAYAFLPEDSEFVDELDHTAGAGSAAMTALFGTNIVYGPHYHAIYQASGTSMDWAYSRGIIHSYILELRDNGEFGFLLPEDQIVPTAMECWTGIMAADAEI